MSRWHVLVAIAGLASGLAVFMVTLNSDHAEERVGHAILGLLIVWSFVGCGLLASVRRPENLTGSLMAAVGFSWLLSSLQMANNDVAFTIGVALAFVPLPVITHLVLAYPEGRLETRPARATTAFAYVAVIVLQLLGTLFCKPGPGSTIEGACRVNCPENLLLVTANDTLASAFYAAVNVSGLLVAIAAITILAGRWRAATRPARRVLAPVLWSGALAALAAVSLFLAGLFDQDAIVLARLATFAVIAFVPVAFLVGLLRGRLAGSAVSRLVLELGQAPVSGRLREALARSLGDPSLRVAYWLPELEEYVDALGQPIELPAPGDGQTATLVERDGRLVGALIHDTALDDQPELVEAVCAAAALALENERLQADLRARLAQLRESEQRHRAVIDSSPVAIVELDPDGNVTLWNAAAERTFGWSAGEIVGTRYPLPMDADLPEVEQAWERVLSGETLALEARRRRRDGSLVELEVTAAPIRDDQGNVVRHMAILFDVTERKRAEEALRHERDFSSTLIDSTACLVVVFDRDGRLIRFNRACEQLTGYRTDEVIGRTFWELFIDPADVEPIRNALERVTAGDFPADNENDWILRDGRRRRIAWSNTALLDARGEVEYLVSSGLDITERMRDEQEIRASRARIVEAADTERRRLERNLHDGAQQRLVALSLALRMAQRQLHTSPDAAETLLAGATDELAHALEELRELARGIHPSVLIDRGLPAAIDALATRSPVPVTVDVSLDGRLPAQVEVAAYYVVSEALANVAKYANASSVSVHVSRSNGLASVEVADDGIGGADPGAGTGLRGLADRVAALDGRLDVQSASGAGTCVRAVIPIVAGPAGERS
ncbi:MAG: PAS domain S-box protein [Gaiellales bacterium]